MIEYRALEVADLDAVRKLMNESSFRIHSNTTEWKANLLHRLHGSAIFDTRHLPAGLVALKKSEIVGFVGFSYRPFAFKELRCTAVVLTDFVVHPNHRGVLGLAITKKVINLFADFVPEIPIIGMHHNESAGKLWERFGAISIPHSDQTWSALLLPSQLVREKFFPAKFILPCANIHFVNKLVSRLIPQCSLEPLTYADLDNDIQLQRIKNKEEISERECAEIAIPPGSDMGVLRTESYLVWRYFTVPQSDFEVFRVLSDNKFSGLIVLKQKNGIAFLYEILPAPGHLINIKTCIKAALRVSFDRRATWFRAKVCTELISREMQDLGLQVSSKGYRQFWVYTASNQFSRATFSFGDFKDD